MLDQASFFQALWDDYKTINPQAGRIHTLLQKRGEQVVNDHIAFRTFNHPNVNIDKLQGLLEDLGYTAKGTYSFTQKKLTAKHFEAAGQPKVFISELRLEDCSEALKSIVIPRLSAIVHEPSLTPGFLYQGRPWSPISWQEYVQLKNESEYAAWLMVFGFRANHFTVLVNALKSFTGLSDLNRYLKSQKFTLNAQGGEIKGGPEEKLEQSSTLAEPVLVKFLDATKEIPGCYYEFAYRYPNPDLPGTLFQGFVTGSADKIFESTDNDYTSSHSRADNTGIDQERG